MIPFVLKQQMEEDPDVVRGYEELWAYCMRLYGIYPKLLRKWYYFYGFYESGLHFLYSWYVISYFISIALAVPYKNTALTSTLVCLGVTTVIYCAVGHNFIYRRELLDTLFRIVGQGFFKYERPLTEKEKEILNKADVQCKRNFFFCNSLGLALTFFQTVLGPVVHALQGKPLSTVVEGGVPINMNLSIPIYLPWDTSTPLLYWLTFFAMIHNGGTEAGIIGAACAFYCNLCTKLNGQLALLAYSLRDIENRAKYRYALLGKEIKDNDQAYYDDQFFHDCMDYCLNENIKHHLVLINFYGLVQEAVGLSIFGVFSGTALLVSPPMFQFASLVEEGDIPELLATGLLFAYIIVSQLSILAEYCINGQQLTNSSDELNFAFYDLQWINTKRSFKQKLLICQANTMKPMILWAKGLFSASNSTLMDILKTTFSYANLLMASEIKE
ncbi:Hypothetical protein NTJ_09424 [Nesidiocoris tenuis]|uniref:Odorant receptor n=1 Tax=Nesidiocoris tenuis TaxID=355587 RepID=A0ABN7AWQ9_9HEMI|nr:Hypothetical protein NTJ_09424 [Nesidiocoris tenuis]